MDATICEMGRQSGSGKATERGNRNVSEPAKVKLWGCMVLRVAGGIVLFFIVSNTGKNDPIYQATTAAPCALDRTAAGNMVQALRDGDIPAIAGLVERGKVVILPEGTRFAVNSDEPN